MVFIIENSRTEFLDNFRDSIVDRLLRFEAGREKLVGIDAVRARVIRFSYDYFNRYMISYQFSNIKYRNVFKACVENTRNIGVLNQV